MTWKCLTVCERNINDPYVCNDVAVSVRIFILKIKIRGKSMQKTFVYVVEMVRKLVFGCLQMMD